MPTLGSDDFSLGWIPSEDAVRGRASGLVRMDNLCLDEDNNVSLTRGTRKVNTSPFASAPLNSYSKVLDGVKHRYVGLTSGVVVKDVDEANTFSTVVASVGGIQDVAYGSTLGQVLICTGDEQKKDDGTYIRDLGLPTPGEPVIDISEKYSLQVFIDGVGLTTEEGTGSTADSDTFRLVRTHAGSDLTAIQNGVTDTDSETDQFTLFVQPNDSTRVQRVRLEFILSETDYFYVEWDFFRNLQYLNKGIDQLVGLTALRNEFVKVGFDSTLGWANVSSIRVVVENATVQDVGVSSLTIEGGRGSLTGTYRYLQVNIFDNGKYIAKSVASAATGIIIADHQFTKITPSVPFGFLSTGHQNECNQIHIYRRNDDIGGDYLLVAIRTDLSEFIDDVSDDVLTGDGIEGSNILNRTANLFLESLPDDIVDLVPNYFRRTVYLTNDFIKVSDIDNPDAIDSRIILDTSGESSEINLWAIKVSDSSLLIGTTVDIYNLTGTLQILSDGTPDVRIRPLGINPPPISDARTVFNSAVIYMSESGWQILGGSNNESLVGGTRLLYENHERYTIPPVLIGGGNTINYDCVVVKNKLFTTVTLVGGLRRCFVYDFIKRYWYPYFLNPTSFFKEEDGTLLATFTDTDDFYLRILDVGQVLDEEPFNGGSLQSFFLQTCYNDSNLPNNRKDLKVLKIYADSGNEGVEVYVSKNGELDTWVYLGVFYFDGPTIQNISLSTTTLNLGKSFALRLVCDSVSRVHNFKFYYWTVEYEARPEQVNYIRVPPSNFGAGGRKRFYDLPFSLDAFGNNFTVTPYLDGVMVPGATETFGGSTTKDFYTIAFRNETIGHELGIDIQVEGNGVIEFYELITPRHTEVLPDLNRWFRIPYTNLGTPARKRFVRIALVIDTRGRNVIFTPLVDDGSLPSVVVNTDRKATFIYYITSEVIGTDLGGVLDGGETPFEFYGWDQDETVTEALPAPAKFIYACTDFGSAARKRFSRNSFVCNPRGGSISFEPILDGIRQGPKVFSGSRKQTFNYFYIEDKIFVDFCYEVISLGDEPFEFYEILKPEILETLPEPVKFYRIPRSNLNTDARKRFFAYAFFLNTRGHDVRFTPYVDGIEQSETSVFNTTTESTCIHYFLSETIGHDIGGNLETVLGDGALAFEFYGVNTDETISEKVPGPAKYLVIPPENLGVAARKRVRTIPLIINTRGGTVRYTPNVDGVDFPFSDHVTTEKRTVLHYFETDSFGIDYGATLESLSDAPFEYYGPGKYENVQTLPVGKKFDQVGPMEFDRRAWIRRIRVRMVHTGNSFEFRIFDKDSLIYSGLQVTTANIEKDYDINLEKGVQGSIFRIELQSVDVFHRYYIDVWHSVTGGETELNKTRL